MPSAVVRLLCESRSASRTVRDASTEQRPFYWRGSSVKFQIALTDGGAFLLEAGVGEIVVEVKALTALALDDSLMRKTYIAEDCDATFTAADWGGGTKQLLEASFTANEAAILPGTYRLIVSHVDGGGEKNVHLSAELQVLDPQSGSVGIDPPPIAWTYLDTVPMVRHDSAQGLNTAQRAQGRANIFAAPEALALSAAPEDDGTFSITVTYSEDPSINGDYLFLGMIGLDRLYGRDLDSVALVGGSLIGGGHVFRQSDTGGVFPWSLQNSSNWATTSPDTILTQTDAPSDRDTHPDPSAVPVWFDVAADADAEDLTISEPVGDGTPGILNQLAAYGSRTFRCSQVSPVRWTELVDTAGLFSNSNSGMRLLFNSAGGLELGLWNATLGIYQVVRISGAAGSETTVIAPLP